MNLNEHNLTEMLRILAEQQTEEKIFGLLAEAGQEYMKTVDGWDHMEMEVAFWQIFTDAMLRPFADNEQIKRRALVRYAAFISGIFEEAAGLPLPEGYQPEPEK